MECWKDVVGFESLFQVSTLGRVLSKRTGRILKQCKTKSGYLTIATKVGGRNGTSYCFKVHRLVAEAFIDNPLSKPCVNHIDSDRSNNCVKNLEWCTHKENYDHGVNFGNIDVSLNCGKSRFDVSVIKDIYLNPDKLSQRSLSRKHGVSKTFVHYVQSGDTLSKITSSF